MRSFVWRWLFAFLPWAVPLAAALDWKQESGYRVAPLPITAGKTGFTLIEPSSIGIHFTNALSPQRVQMFQNLMNGSGLAAADVDGDGRVDLYFCHKQEGNQLYRNLGGGRFTNITAHAGSVACTNQTSVGAVFGDLNGNGSQDLVVTGFGGPNVVLLNDGQGRFTDVSATAGISGKSGYTSVALSDVDGDGDLDLYLCNFGVQAILRDGGTISTRVINGQLQVTGRNANRMRVVDGMIYEFGEPDTLFLNDGQAKFTPVPWEKSFIDARGKPMSPPWDFGLAVQIRDANDDGFPDIYVCNDFQTPDRLWLGDGRGQFREAPLVALRNMSYASMGVDFADLDRDGRYDFVTVEMLSENLEQHLRTSSPTRPTKRTPGAFLEREDFARNCLYWNRGDGTWAEIANFAGVSATSWSWTPIFLDVDLDGWEDLLVSNGHMHDVNNRDVTEKSRPRPGQSLHATKDRLLQYPPLEPPKFAFRNRRDLTFENVSEQWRFDSLRIAHGMITVDWDEDGDLDVILNAVNGPPLMYRNDSPAPRVAVRVRGVAPNTGGIGAQLILTGGPATQRQEIVAGGQYLSHSETQRTFAAGTTPMELEVRWRSGKRSVIRGLRANHLYEIDEAGAAPAPVIPVPPVPTPWFTDVSDRLKHSHAEPAHDDLTIQPLLPQLYSQLGPGVAWADLNGDGHLDLFVGSGRGGRLGTFLGDGRGAFTAARVPGPTFPDDLTGLASWVTGTGQRMILAGLANYESSNVPGAPAVVGWSAGSTEIVSTNLIPAGRASPGPVAVGDVDGDGDLDVFVGARLTLSRWPEPGGSQFYRNDGGTLHAENANPFASVGPVSDALWVDLDDDGFLELVLATELGPVRIFSRVDGTFQDQTRAWGLEEMTGWWNSVAAGDFDGDGRMDLVAGNRGLNSYWQTWSGGAPQLIWTSSDATSPVTVIEVAPEGGKLHPLRDRTSVALAMPDLPSRIPTHDAYAAASIPEILGASASGARETHVKNLASAVLLNRGRRFDLKPLPREAQWTPAFGLAVADFNADGRLDVAVAQNLFAVRPDDTRIDAGRGLLLQGDGRGSFHALSSQVSGIVADGEQRGAAAADFDEDGRMDLVITQNGASTVLLHNSRTPSGLRVRLVGPPGNPDGLGAVVRARQGQTWGSAQTITGGGGYWSQASAVLVVGGERPRELQVRWPGGKLSRVPVVPSGQEAVVHWSTAGGK